MAIADKTTELSEHVLDAVRKGQQGALDAVRTFVETIDQALPLQGAGSGRRQEIIDSALAMADRLVQTQYDFLSTVIRTAGGAFGSSSAEAAPAAEKAPAAKVARVKVARAKAAPAKGAAAAEAAPAKADAAPEPAAAKAAPAKRARRPVKKAAAEAEAPPSA